MFGDIQIDLQELNTFTIIFRIFLSILIGGIVGVERNLKNRTAGLRTYMLVCFSSTIVMMTNQYITEIYPNGFSDPARMGAQVISGIGFLGAGTILVTERNRIKGLTTAAGLWASAIIGLAVGIGFYSLAIIGGITMLIIIVLMRPLKRYVQGKSDQIDFYAVVDSVDDFNEFVAYCANLRVNIQNLRVEQQQSAEQESIYYVSIDLDNRIRRADFMAGINALDGISLIEELEDA